MPDINPDKFNPSSGRINDSERKWSAIRRLSEQLTEVTLAAMQKADASFPDKPLLDVPILSCPHCHKTDHHCFNDSIDESIESSNWHSSLQRCGRSKSVALSGHERGCKYCAAYFYQNPLKDYVWSRPHIQSNKTAWQHSRSFHSQKSSLIPGEVGTDEIPILSGLYRDLKFENRKRFSAVKRRSSSLTELPPTSSQHTQTIFSSITPINEFINKSRCGLKSGSFYTKQASGLRFQLPAALQKSKSVRKRGLDFGLRKTLSVTNAIVRMPIESATSSSRKKLDYCNTTGDPSVSPLLYNATSSPSIPKSTQDTPLYAQSNKFGDVKQTNIILNELYNPSDTGSLRSLPTDHILDPLCQEEEFLKDGHRVSMNRRYSQSDRHLEQDRDSIEDDAVHLDEETLFKVGKRDVRLQTMEDFEKEIKLSFNIPRILNEEDQTKEPAGDVERDAGLGFDDSSKQRSKEYWKEQFLLFFQPSDNKLAKKLFGTKVALNKERTRQRKQGKWIIHPASNFR
ncbi:unnamed protein product [Rodentolepis nana]|uniref:Ion_trans_N domain-containing protein n=1 Tax=Rodentolepis nana TaxID=102285 RepID=A0A0R3TVW5_RODNA|nr:unnamed protein product [Rodentolepis nana]